MPSIIWSVLVALSHRVGRRWGAVEIYLCEGVGSSSSVAMGASQGGRGTSIITTSSEGTTEREREREHSDRAKNLWCDRKPSLVFSECSAVDHFVSLRGGLLYTALRDAPFW